MNTFRLNRVIESTISPDVSFPEDEVGLLESELNERIGLLTMQATAVMKHSMTNLVFYIPQDNEYQIVNLKIEREFGETV